MIWLNIIKTVIGLGLAYMAISAQLVEDWDQATYFAVLLFMFRMVKPSLDE